MANAKMEFYSYVNVRAIVELLSSPANQYNNFIFKLYKWSGSAWTNVGYYYAYGWEFGSQYWADHYFNGQEPGAYYYVETYANWKGQWYPADPSVAPGFTTAWAQAPALPSGNISNITTQKTTAVFDYTNTVGTLTLQYWDSSIGWRDISTWGGPYSTTSITNGYRITLTNLIPETSYYFRVVTNYNGYSSIGPSSGYQTVNTQSWPSIPSAVSISSRYDGGLNLTWGDHGYEGSGFQYGLDVDGSYWYVYSDNSTSWYFGDWGVSHTFRVCTWKTGYGASGTFGSYASAATGYTTGTTAPSVPTLSAYSNYPNGIPCTIGLQHTSNWTYIKVWYRRKYSSDAWQSIQISNPDTQGTIYSLTVGLDYEIKASTFYYVNGVYLESIGYTSLIYLQYGSARPANWSWSTTIAVGASVYGVSGNIIYILSASEWNAFTAKINAFRTYKGLSAVTFTTAVRGTTLTSAIFNEAINALTGLSSYFTNGKTIPSTKFTGDPIIVASYYIDMRDALNSIL